MTKNKKTKPRKDSEEHRSGRISKPGGLSTWQIGVVAGAAVLVVGVLWLKGNPVRSGASSGDAPVLVTPSGEGVEAAVLPEEFLPENTAHDDEGQSSLAPREGESPEQHFDRMMEEGQPILAFFHSYTCYQCTEMDKIVQAVHPEFAGQVGLVDVDVYDDANRPFLVRAGIRVIPTLIFIDQNGQGGVSTGIVPGEQLHEVLSTLAAGGTP